MPFRNGVLGILIWAAGCHPLEPEPSSYSWLGAPMIVSCGDDGVCDTSIVARNDGPGCVADPWGVVYFEDAAGTVTAAAEWKRTGVLFPGEPFVVYLRVPLVAVLTLAGYTTHTHDWPRVCPRRSVS